MQFSNGFTVSINKDKFTDESGNEHNGYLAISTSDDSGESFSCQSAEELVLFLVGVGITK